MPVVRRRTVCAQDKLAKTAPLENMNTGLAVERAKTTPLENMNTGLAVERAKPPLENTKQHWSKEIRSLQEGKYQDEDGKKECNDCKIVARSWESEPDIWRWIKDQQRLLPNEM